MNTVQFLQSGFLAALIAAGLLASAPGFEHAHRGWLPRFGWILVRYVLPPVVLIGLVSWCLLRR